MSGFQPGVNAMEVSSFSRVSLVWKLFTRSGLKRLRVVVTKKKKKKETKGGGKFYALVQFTQETHAKKLLT